MSMARVLVVDDDPQIRRILRMALVKHGFEVTDARSGDEALQKFEAAHCDLVILDMNMPGTSGLQTCRILRSTTDAAIIMLTIRDSEEDKIKALDAGADDYVTKPFSVPELLARARAALRRLPQSAESGPQVVAVDDLEINFITRRVTLAGTEVALTPKEFDLLHYLVTHPNIPIPHTRLLQAVWGPDYGNEVEYLRVFVNRLRKKIEKNVSKPEYLVTEPFVGYRFNIPTLEK
jgi:two-component system, OmpR family, KDP operon response regulator KdpE